MKEQLATIRKINTKKFKNLKKIYIVLEMKKRSKKN